MDEFLTICYHQMVGFVFSVLEAMNIIIVGSAVVLLGIGLFNAGTWLIRTIRITSDLERKLKAVAESVLLADLTGQPDAEGSVRVIPEEKAASAFTLGFIKPEVYLTSALIENFTPEEIDIVVQHELGHKQRRDPLRQTVLEFLGRLFWFVPVMGRQIVTHGVKTELACDAMALTKGYSRTSIAATLVKISEAPVLASHAPVPAISSIIDKLEIRVRALLGEKPDAYLRIPAGIIIASTLIIFAIMTASTAAVASQYDPGGYVTMIEQVTDTCEYEHTDVDPLSSLGLECPHCGPQVFEADESEPPSCH